MAFKKFTASTKTLTPDPVYHSRLVSKFINALMQDGKKAVSERIVYGAMDIIAQKIKDVPPLEVFEKAVNNVKPMIEVRSKRVGGANYQVPMQVNSKRALSLSFRWLRDAVRAGKGSRIAERLASELQAAYKGEGAAMTTRENVHRMADANKAFAHFAW
jgi:small subunit ribosomal protein S7